MGMNEMSEAMEMQRRDDEAAIAWAISLKQYCENNDCTNCIFNSMPFMREDEGCCCLRGEPWNTPTKPFMQKFKEKYQTNFDA